MLIQEEYDSKAYSNFTMSLKTNATRKHYLLSLTQFVQYCNLRKVSELMGLTADELRDKIVKYFQEKKGVSKSTQRVRLAAIKHFCEMNDIMLNWKKISKFVHSEIPKSTDRGYSQTEIKQVIDFSDHRVKAAFLCLTSTGIRAGALREIKIKNIEDKGELYKLMVYCGEEEEYFTFTTPECKIAIDRYLDFRRRNGESISKESYLFVRQYNNMRRIHPRLFAERSLEGILQQWLVNSGIRRQDPVNRYRRKEVQRLHGFRKFFTTQLVHSKVIPEIREMLLGHKIGLTSIF
jgi:site-specific recombinase XerD